MAGTADVQNGHTVTQATASQLATSFGYNTALALTQSVMPNSATTSQNFSSSTGLLTSSVSVHGATTNYTYAFSPTVVTAATNGHWAKSYKDGFGRDLAVETGYGTTIVSHTATVYGPCACSPLGKATQISLPYAIGGGGQVTASDGSSNIGWNTYAYDGLGRTVTQTAADGSATQYVYVGNTTKATDPAGNWKRYTKDALGNLVKVEEPNPAYGQADSAGTNFVTTCCVRPGGASDGSGDAEAERRRELYADADVRLRSAERAAGERDESGERDGELCVLCERAAAVEDGCEGAEGGVFV
jgi:hypothetical protein